MVIGGGDSWDAGEDGEGVCLCVQDPRVERED